MVEAAGDKCVDSAFFEIAGSNPVYSFEGSGPKRLVIMSGLPLSGKTFFVNRMNRFRPGKFQQVNSHTVRPVVVKHMGRKKPAYDIHEHRATFEVCHRLLLLIMKNGWPVIADATNLSEKYRTWALDAGRKSGAEILTVFMEVTDGTAQNRFREKMSESSATYETYMQLKSETEPANLCSTKYLVVNSEADISPHVADVAKWLSGESDTFPATLAPKQIG